MKSSRPKLPIYLLLPLFALFTADAGLSQEAGTGSPAEDPPTPEVPKEPVKQLQSWEESLPRSWNKLDADQQAMVKKNLGEAAALVRGIRLQEALAELLKTEEIIPDLYQIHNLKGAVFTKMRDFAKARESFQKAVDLNKEGFHPKFNLSELDFVEGNYQKAYDQFSSLIKENKGALDMGTRRLMEFKLVICLLKLDREEDVKTVMDDFNYLDDTPAYYFANAAVAFQKDDKEAAQSWISSARKIYSAPQLEIYVDSFVEVGWIETL